MDFAKPLDRRFAGHPFVGVSILARGFPRQNFLDPLIRHGILCLCLTL